ncbi:hypothetical protein JOD43_000104 [Pullulanibacillus pueri]|nr:hypothetical protein [Pullulanibacillus pueri]
MIEKKIFYLKVSSYSQYCKKWVLDNKDVDAQHWNDSLYSYWDNAMDKHSNTGWVCSLGW